jgi:hypothetical protein
VILLVVTSRRVVFGAKTCTVKESGLLGSQRSDVFDVSKDAVPSFLTVEEPKKRKA